MVFFDMVNILLSTYFSSIHRIIVWRAITLTSFLGRWILHSGACKSVWLQVIKFWRYSSILVHLEIPISSLMKFSRTSLHNFTFLASHWVSYIQGRHFHGLTPPFLIPKGSQRLKMWFCELFNDIFLEFLIQWVFKTTIDTHILFKREKFFLQSGRIEFCLNALN